MEMKRLADRNAKKAATKVVRLGNREVWPLLVSIGLFGTIWSASNTRTEEREAQRERMIMEELRLHDSRRGSKINEEHCDELRAMVELYDEVIPKKKKMMAKTKARRERDELVLKIRVRCSDLAAGTS